MIKKEKKYFEGVGRRKSSVARARLVLGARESGFSVNGKKSEEYFPTEELRLVVTSPFKATLGEKGFAVSAKVSGGGSRGQAEAVRLACARALVKADSDYHRALRDLDYLKRDPREKERKKPGLKKARRAPQWAKR